MCTSCPVGADTFIVYLQITYRFRGGLHQAIVGDREVLRLPLRSKSPPPFTPLMLSCFVLPELSRFIACAVEMLVRRERRCDLFTFVRLFSRSTSFLHTSCRWPRCLQQEDGLVETYPRAWIDGTFKWLSAAPPTLSRASACSFLDATRKAV